MNNTQPILLIAVPHQRKPFARVGFFDDLVRDFGAWSNNFPDARLIEEDAEVTLDVLDAWMKYDHRMGMALPVPLEHSVLGADLVLSLVPVQAYDVAHDALHAFWHVEPGDEHHWQEDEVEAIRLLRRRGMAVTVFTAEEIGEASVSDTEEAMVASGWAIISTKWEA